MKKIICFILLLLCIDEVALCQECMSSAPQFSSVPCVLNYMNYYESPTTMSNAPTISMRVNIHVMQKNDNSGSFVNNAATINYLSGLFAVDNTVCPHTMNFTPYGHVEPATWQIDVGGIPVPFVMDAKIRFILTGIYFHQDDVGWDQNNQSSCGNYCYSNYAVNPGTDLNIFFVNYSSGFGCGPGSYIIIGDRWDLEDVTDINNLWGIRTLLGHEIGHCLGLNHVGSWSGRCSIADDLYDDTPHPDNRPVVYGNCPPLIGPQTGCTPVSNNVMGYNGCQGYFSPKQIAQMRQTIQNQQKSLVECQYNSSSNYSISTSTTWDASRIYDGNISINNNSTLTVNCSLYMPDGSTITVESGSELIVNGVITNLCSTGWDGVIDIKPGGILNLQSGAEITYKGNGKINIQDNISSPARLVFDQGAKVYLDGYNSSIEINGDLEIGNNANFAFQHHNIPHGYVKFGSTSIWPSKNVIAGTNSSINLIGSSTNHKVLEIAQETFYGPANLVNFNISGGTVVLHPNSRVQADGLSTAINFTNAKFTSNTPGVNNGHRGVHLYGQSNVTINNCVFEYGLYGIYSYMTYGGSPLNIVSSIFRHNTYGIRAYDKGLGLYSCNFYSNDFGVFAEHMSFSSTFIEGHVGGGITNKNTTGIWWLGYSTPTLTLDNPYINSNRTGVDVQSSVLNVKCGSISYNTQEGILIRARANLFMNDQVAVPNAASVTVFNNLYSIKADNAWYIWLNKGFNELSPSSIGNEKTASGSLAALPYNIIANVNKWNSNGTLTSSDYHLFNSNGTNYTITDNSVLSSVAACGQAIPPCPMQPCSNQSPLEYCPSCDVINTDDFFYTKLNIATKDAIAKLNSNDPEKYKDAVNLFYQILNETYNNPDEKEQYLLNLNYIKMMEALGNAYKYEEIVCEENNIPGIVSQVISIQDKFIDIAIIDNNYNFRFKYSMDKAQTLRLSCKRQESLNLLNDIRTWSEGAADNNAVALFICEISIEIQVLDGTIKLEEIAAAMANCSQSHERVRNESDPISYNGPFEILQVDVFNDILSNEVAIKTNAEKAHLVFYNSIGEIIEETTINYDYSIDASSISKGIYLIKITNLKTKETSTTKVSIN